MSDRTRSTMTPRSANHSTARCADVRSRWRPTRRCRSRRRPCGSARPSTVSRTRADLGASINAALAHRPVTGEPLRRYECTHPVSAEAACDRRRRGCRRTWSTSTWINAPGRDVSSAVRSRLQPGRHRSTRDEPATDPRIGISVRAHRRLTTTPAWPTPRSAPTRRPPPRLRVLQRAAGVVRRARRHCRTRAVRQLGRPTGRTPGATPATELRVTPEADPTVPAANQRQDRAIPPHAGRWLGLRAGSTSQPKQRDTAPTRLAALLQSLTPEPTPPSEAQPPVTRLTNLPGHHS